MSNRRAKAQRRAATSGQTIRPPSRKATLPQRRAASRGARTRARGGSAQRRSPAARPALDLWRSIWRWGPLAAAGDRAPLTALAHADLAWAGATAAASAALFATIITGHPGLGDAPETVSGVSALGVLHSPGYPAYVLAAHAFTLLVPVGSEALRVNLFSLLCASLTVGGVQLLGRRCGAARWAASIAALCLAAGAGFWFYAGFAKHDMFSGLLFLVALHLALAWRARPSTKRLVGLAAAFAVGLGSSWPLMLLLMPTVAWVLIPARAEVSPRALALATGTGLVILLALYGFVMVRAAENPALNWGGANNVSRLVELVTRADFIAHGSSSPASVSASGGASSGGASLAGSVAAYVLIFARELGVVGLILCAFGLLLSLRLRRGAGSYPLLITFVVNLVGATVLVGAGSSHSSNVDLIEEGFLLGCYFALACWLAIAITELGTAGSAGFLRSVRPLAFRNALRPAWLIAIAAVLLVPSVLTHWATAHRDSTPFADRYASTALGELPRNAALLVWGAELTQPLIYRQVVDHQRADVVVIAADGLSYGWYRDQLSRRLGRPLPNLDGNPIEMAAQVAQAVSRFRPVYLDPQAAQTLQRFIGYRQVGLLAQLAGGQGPAPVGSPAQLDATMRTAVRVAGMPNANWNVWPNDYVASAEYSTAALEVARAYYEHHDLAGLRRALLGVLRITPADKVAQADLAHLDGS
jgi:hypothetical protein